MATPERECGALEDDDLYAPCLHSCELPEGHDGPHRFTYEWSDPPDSGRTPCLVDDDGGVCGRDDCPRCSGS